MQRIEADWRTRVLSVITNPTVAYLLLLIGIYGLIFEGYNPGAILPGVVGAICLLLAAYALQVLPVNYAGLALIALGIGLMIAEVFAPSFGALGIGGVAAFVIGSVILIDSDVPGFQISRTLIGAVATVGAGLLFAYNCRGGEGSQGADGQWQGTDAGRNCDWRGKISGTKARCEFKVKIGTPAPNPVAPGATAAGNRNGRPHLAG